MEVIREEDLSNTRLQSVLSLDFCFKQFG